jgi:hypothetical protein
LSAWVGSIRIEGRKSKHVSVIVECVREAHCLLGGFQIRWHIS